MRFIPVSFQHHYYSL